jgi:hypothetical protein
MRTSGEGAGAPNKELLLSEWEGWDRSYSGGACLPGRTQFWSERREWYSGVFQSHVDSVSAHCWGPVQRRGGRKVA